MRITFVCVVLLAASAPVFAANFSGKWAVRADTGRGGGRGAPVLTLLHAGDNVTGEIRLPIDLGTNSPVNNEIWDGKADGNTLSFYVWTGQDRPVKTTYRGTLSASGDEIVFTVTRGGANAGPPVQMTAQRVK